MGRFVFALVGLGLGLALIFGYPFESRLLTKNPSTEGVGPDLTRLKSFPAGAIDGERIVNAEQSRAVGSHARTYDEQRFSPLSQVNAENAGQLGLAWYFETGTDRGLEASPIVVDGVMFTTGSWSVVYANDAVTGELIWKYDPEVPKSWGANACCDVVNRGVAVWKGRVYVGTIDGRLIALDAETGDQSWSVNTIDRSKPYTITGLRELLKTR